MQNFLNQLVKEIKCSICDKLPDNPLVYSCGHHACSECFYSLLETTVTENRVARCTIEKCDSVLDALKTLPLPNLGNLSDLIATQIRHLSFATEMLDTLPQENNHFSDFYNHREDGDAFDFGVGTLSQEFPVRLEPHPSPDTLSPLNSEMDYNYGSPALPDSFPELVRDAKFLVTTFDLELENIEKILFDDSNDNMDAVLRDNLQESLELARPANAIIFDPTSSLQIEPDDGQEEIEGWLTWEVVPKSEGKKKTGRTSFCKKEDLCENCKRFVNGIYDHLIGKRKKYSPCCYRPRKRAKKANNKQEIRGKQTSHEEESIEPAFSFNFSDNSMDNTEYNSYEMPNEMPSETLGNMDDYTHSTDNMMESEKKHDSPLIQREREEDSSDFQMQTTACRKDKIERDSKEKEEEYETIIESAGQIEHTFEIPREELLEKDESKSSDAIAKETVMTFEEGTEEKDAATSVLLSVSCVDRESEKGFMYLFDD